MLVGPDDYPFVFGHYVLERSLAVGGMGEIYLAALRGVKRRCAIKTIRPEYVGNETLIHRFMDEGKIMVNIDHDNVVRCFDWGQLDDTYYIAMEYVHGTSVAELMDAGYSRGVRIPLGIGLHVARAVLDALSYLHRSTDENGRPLQLIHRDLSPDNILIGFDGSVKLADFGLARAKLMPARTVGDVPLGKWGYMAPEQARHGDIDNRTDIYGLGCSLFELFTGKRLIDDRQKDLEVLWNKVLNPQHPTPTDVRGKLPAEFNDFILRAVQVKPQNRYQNAEQMRDALDALETKCATLDDLCAYLRRFFPPDKIKMPPIPDTSQFEMRKDKSVVFALSSETAQHALDLDELPSEWVNLDDSFDGEQTVVPEFRADISESRDVSSFDMPTGDWQPPSTASGQTLDVDEVDHSTIDPETKEGLQLLHEEMPTLAEFRTEQKPPLSNPKPAPAPLPKINSGSFASEQASTFVYETNEQDQISDDKVSKIIQWIAIALILGALALIAAAFLIRGDS